MPSRTQRTTPRPSKMPSLPARRRVSYTQDRHMFHCLIQDGITYLCMAEEVRRGGEGQGMLRAPIT